jgi:Holliday junction resolvasome RuvABC endonuclease subunit
MALTGYGRSDKAQIRKAVEMIFSVNEITGPDDISDAIAIAVSGAGAISFRQKIIKSRG